MTVGTVLLLTGIFIIIGAITTALMVWFGFKRPKYRKEHFTARTTGTVERMSNFYSNDIRVPLVSYTVEGQQRRSTKCNDCKIPRGKDR